MKHSRFFFAAILLALMSIAGIALAEVVQTHYTVLRNDEAPTALKDGIAVVDTDVWTTPVKPQKSEGNPSVAAFVSGNTASATVTLGLGLYLKKSDGTYVFLGDVSKQTVTLSAGTEKDGSLFVGTTVPTWDTRGAPYYDLRVLTISGGTATVKAWSYGSDSKPAKP